MSQNETMQKYISASKVKGPLDFKYSILVNCTPTQLWMILKTSIYSHFQNSEIPDGSLVEISPSEETEPKNENNSVYYAKLCKIQIIY